MSYGQAASGANNVHDLLGLEEMLPVFKWTGLTRPIPSIFVWMPVIVPPIRKPSSITKKNDCPYSTPR